MTSPAQTTFTAAQIARALGRRRQAVARQLAMVEPKACAVVSGAPVKAWALTELPAEIQSGLELAAQRCGFRDACAMLADPRGSAWQPAFKLADVSPGAMEKAVKLQRSLARMLARRNDSTIAAAEMEAMGMADYSREFGHAISARTIRTLFNRTLDRAGDGSDFARLELYLPENVALKKPVKQVVPFAVESEFDPLRQAIFSFQNPVAPSLAEKNYFWLRICETFDQKVSDGRAPKKLKRELLTFLESRAPFLVSPDCLSPGNQMRVNFQRKYEKWRSNGREAAALSDARAKASGNFRAPELTPGDRDKLIAHAVLKCGGRVAQAWRELNQSGQMSEGVFSYYLNNPSRKSYVPKRIADSVKHEVAMLYDLHHGPRQAKLNGAHIFRDWSGVHSLDWWQGDDFTFPVYFKAPDENGQLVLMRGQTLLMIDLRTTRILGFVLIAEPHYTANAIRTLITNVADVYGLPRKGFYFEHGTWEAKILTGDKNAQALSWPETRAGLTEFGLEFHHANLPRAKPIERIGGMLQNIMEGLAAYVGRNEMIEKFERTQKSLERARKGDAAALAQIMDHAEWVELLAKLCEVYNADRQDGKMTGGLSPDAAFAEFADHADPPVKFSADCRYLLAHQRRAIRVTKNGITFRINKEVFNFRSVETSPLIGQTVLTWFNPELPEILTVTDMERKNPFTVARTQEVPAMNAPPELLAKELDRIEQHMSYPKARYKVLRATSPMQFRTMIADKSAIDLGAQFEQQQTRTQIAITENNRRTKEFSIEAARAGIVLPAGRPIRAEQVEAAARLNELLASDDSTNGETKP